MAEQDTEITLGTSRLLGLFFGLVVVCAVFFGLGFSMGRNSVKSNLTMESAPSPTLTAQTGGQKANPGVPEKTATAGPDPQPAEATAPVVTSPAPATTAANTPAPEINKGTPLSPNGGGAYTVQIAAVTKEEDAEALVSALKKKSYPVFMASNNTDKLFHVQIGPFSDIKDAEATKAKLTGDGYNPIVKR